MKLLAIGYYAPPQLTPQAIQVARLLYYLDARVTLLHGRDPRFPDAYHQYPDFFSPVGALAVADPGAPFSGLLQRAALRPLRPEVGYLDTLARGSGALLVIDAPSCGDSIFLPSKLIENIGARRPVWPIIPPGTSAELVSEWAGGPHASADPADPHAAARMLLAGCARQPESRGPEPYPALSVSTPPHYWSKFGFSTARTRGLFVSVLRSNCLSARPSISFSGAGATIAVGGRVVSVTEQDVTVK